MPRPVRVAPLAARRFMIRAQGLWQPFNTVAAALSHLGYVQIDPLNICGRMQDLILRNRVIGYREGDLMRHVHGEDGRISGSEAAPVAPLAHADRVAFEHHHPETHVLVAFPLEAWPHLLGAMRARMRQTGAWSGRLTPTEKKLVPSLLAEINARGPLGSEDFADERRARRVVWGAATLVKSTLQKLFFHGQLLIAQRSNGRRRYDLPERVLPRETLGRPEAPAAETQRWLVVLKLRQRRLAPLKRAEWHAVADVVQPVVIDDCPPLYCLNEDVPSLAACEPGNTSDPDPAARAGGPTGAPATPLLLAPLDPLIYDRRVTRTLWNFDYTWEAYTPAARRVRGHYALPVLAGTELIGHVEPKADRAAGRLIVASRSIRRGYSVSGALDELAAWLGLKR